MGDYTLSNSQDVKATQLEEDTSVVTPNGPVEGKAGSWAVEFPNGNTLVMTDDEWQKAQGGTKDEKEKTRDIGSPGNVGSEKESDNGDDAAEDTESETGDVKKPATDTVTPDKPSRDSRDTPKTEDDRF